MWLLLIISLLIPIVLIGYSISKVDLFLAKGGFTKEIEETRPTAIVLGKTELARQVTELLERNAIPVFRLTEPFLVDQTNNFCYLFALSKNDADNIILCKIGKRVYSIEKMISLCNDRMSEGLFMSEGIRYMAGNEVTAQNLYQAILPEMEAEL